MSGVATLGLLVASGLLVARALPPLRAGAAIPPARVAAVRPATVAASPSTGYWLVASDGGVFNFGVPFYGSTGGVHLNEPIVGMAPSPDYGGYFLVASDGGVFPFGDAHFHGSTGSVHLNQPIVGMAVDATTGGYWLVASDGGIFNFDAPFYGSTGAVHLNRPIVGMAATPDGGGYFLVASDGGVFPFGDAHFHGSTGGTPLNRPIVGMATDVSTGGYWLVASDGGIFNFDAPFLGSTGGVPLNRPIVSMAAAPYGAGYYLVASDGGVFNFGLPFAGSTGGVPLNRSMVAMAAMRTGATARGVTNSSITVAFRLTADPDYEATMAELAGASLHDTNAVLEQTVLALGRYFNEHAPFFGRQLKIVFYNGRGNTANELLGGDLAQAGADAATAGQQLKAFADLSAESEPYADALTKQGVLAFGEPYLSEEWMAQHGPFAWSVQGEGTTAAADYALAKLCPAGTPASYAGGVLANSARKFAIVTPSASWYLQSAQAAQAYLQAHGCTASLDTYTLDLGTMSQQATNLVAALKGGSYTTVICGCDAVFNVYFSGQANNDSYWPEVVVGGTGETDQDDVAQLWNQTFAAHIIGVSGSTPARPSTQSPGYLAYKSVSSGQPSLFVNQIYEQMQQLALGIEGAGPDLTPTTFEQGMFHSPASEGPDGLWKFGPAQFTAPSDVREICWSPNTTSPVNGKPGSFVGTSSARWLPGQIPHGTPGCPIPG